MRGKNDNVGFVNEGYKYYYLFVCNNFYLLSNTISVYFVNFNKVA